MASKQSEHQSPVKKRFTSPLGNQKYVTKNISPRFKANLKDFRSVGPGKQSKQRDLGPTHGKPWRKPQERGGRAKAVRFHCGGNSEDPLNLNSLIDRDPSVVTPQASPLSVHSASPVEVVEPRDQTDPLNLKRFPPDPEKKESHSTPKKRKKKKRHPKNHNSENEVKPKEQSGVTNQPVSMTSEGKKKRKRKNPKSEDASLTKNEKDTCISNSDQKGVKSSDGKDDLINEEELEPCPKKKVRTASETIEDLKTEDSRNNKMEASSPVAKDKKILETKRDTVSHKEKLFKKGKDHLAGKKGKKEKLFIYGNYNRYYGYRNPQATQDLRLKCFRKEWFAGKDVLDLGCNVGHVTLTIARDFSPHVIMGIDIDTSLIKAAKNNIRYYVKGRVAEPGTSGGEMDFPISFSVTSGPLAAPVVLGSGESVAFPHNVIFKQVKLIQKIS